MKKARAVPPAQSSPKQSLIESLRESIKPENLPPKESIFSKPQLFLNDQGRPIPEAAWNELQKRKRKAEKGNYVLEDFSQL